MNAENGRTAVESRRHVQTQPTGPVRRAAPARRGVVAGSSRLVVPAAQILESVLAADLYAETGCTLEQLARQWADDRARERVARRRVEREAANQLRETGRRRELVDRRVLLERLDRFVYRCSCGEWRLVGTLERVPHRCPRCTSQQGGTGALCRLTAGHDGMHFGGVVRVTRTGNTYARRWA